MAPAQIAGGGTRTASDFLAGPAEYPLPRHPPRQLGRPLGNRPEPLHPRHAPADGARGASPGRHRLLSRDRPAPCRAGPPRRAGHLGISPRRSLPRGYRSRVSMGENAAGPRHTLAPASPPVGRKYAQNRYEACAGTIPPHASQNSSKCWIAVERAILPPESWSSSLSERSGWSMRTFPCMRSGITIP